MKLWPAVLGLAVVLVGCSGDERKPKPEPKLFGFNSELSLWAVRPKTEVRYERMVGANAQRYVASWRDLQPRQDDPSLTPGAPRAALDDLYRELIRYRMTPIVIAGNAPPWATDRKARDWLPPDRNHVDDWQRFVKAVARRYPKAVIEPWNEPNLARVFWRPGPADPALMARLQCAAFRAVPRNRTVLSTGFAVREGFTDYADAFLDAGGGRCYDGLSVHLYNGPRDLPLVRRVDGKRPIWVTETGVPSVPGEVSEAEQAKVNLQLYDAFIATRDIRAVLFNTLRNAQNPPLVHHPENRDYHFGFLRVDFSPKPTFCTIAKRRRQADACP